MGVAAVRTEYAEIVSCLTHDGFRTTPNFFVMEFALKCSSIT
jgi:hypothetical protein